MGITKRRDKAGAKDECNPRRQEDASGVLDKPSTYKERFMAFCGRAGTLRRTRLQRLDVVDQPLVVALDHEDLDPIAEHCRLVGISGEPRLVDEDQHGRLLR